MCGVKSVKRPVCFNSFLKLNGVINFWKLFHYFSNFQFSIYKKVFLINNFLYIAILLAAIEISTAENIILSSLATDQLMNNLGNQFPMSPVNLVAK